MDPHTNFPYSTVATAPSPAASGTSLTVAAGEGANFPAAVTADPSTWFNATVWPVGQIPKKSNAEIVRVTNRSGDVLTILRAQEGTIARTVVVGDQIAATITTKVLTDIEAKTNPPGTIIEHAGVDAPAGTLPVDGAAVSRTTYPALFDAVTHRQTGTLTSTSNAVTGLADTSKLAVGWPVEGTGVPAGATIATITSATAITLSAAATVSAGSVLRFFPHGRGDGATTFNVPDKRGRQTVSRGTHADNAVLGSNDGLAVASRTQKHGHGHTLTLPDHGHGLGDSGHSHGSDTGVLDGGPVGNFPNSGSISNGGYRTGVSGTGVVVGSITSAPAIPGAVGVAGGVTNVGANIVLNHFIVT